MRWGRPSSRGVSVKTPVPILASGCCVQMLFLLTTLLGCRFRSNAIMAPAGDRNITFCRGMDFD